jgi:hypothetical protein
MTREECIELALQGSKAAELSEEATDIYVDIAEHLLETGHADSVAEVDIILQGMTTESAEAILALVEGSESLSEGHKEIAKGLEADPEGYMVLRQLATAENAIERIRMYIGGDKMMQLPAWVQSKLTMGAEAMDMIADYLLADTDSEGVEK